MSVSFNPVARPNPKDPQAPKKYYASVVATGRCTVQDLSKTISKRCTVTGADIMAVLHALLDIIPEELAHGHIVDLGAFGSFWLRNTSLGVDEEEQVTAEQVTNLLVRFLPGQELKGALKDVQLVKARQRPVRSRAKGKR